MKALHFVRFKDVTDFLRLGWMVSIPNAPMHHHYYGIELKWLCNCPIATPSKVLQDRV